MKLPLISLALFSGLALGHPSHLEELNETFAPLPKTAQGVEVPASGYVTMPLGFGAYVVLDGSYQAMFIVSNKGVIVVDAPPTTDMNLMFAIGNVTDKPVTHMVYSHAHADHIGSAFRFAGPHVDIIAHEETLRILQETSPDPFRPLPKTTFKNNFNLVVGNQSVQLSYKGENHSPGNIFIYMKAAKALMLVDVVFPGWVPFSELAVSSNIPKWVKAHEEILSFDFTHYIGGHLNRIGTREDVLTQQAYIHDLFSNCNATIALSKTNDPIIGANSILGTVQKNNPGNKWAQFKVYLDVVAERCANITNEKWGTILGAADVFGFENAYTVVESLRIDYDVLGPFRP